MANAKHVQGQALGCGEWSGVGDKYRKCVFFFSRGWPSQNQLILTGWGLIARRALSAEGMPPGVGWRGTYIHTYNVVQKSLGGVAP